MEDELRAFRSRVSGNVKNKVPESQSENSTASTSKHPKESTWLNNLLSYIMPISYAREVQVNVTDEALTNPDKKKRTWIDNGILATKILLWCLLMTLFVILEFGAVFFVFSVFYFIYRNLRSTPRKPGEPSAYSVFNPNCEAIDGTLNAEQFERELKFGAGAIH